MFLLKKIFLNQTEEKEKFVSVQSLLVLSKTVLFQFSQKPAGVLVGPVPVAVLIIRVRLEVLWSSEVFIMQQPEQNQNQLSVNVNIRTWSSDRTGPVSGSTGEAKETILTF